MKFSLMYGCPQERRGTYYVNRVKSSPTVGFTDMEEAITEAHRLHHVGRTLHIVNTYEMHDGTTVGLVHTWGLGVSTRFTNQESTMAKYTVTTVPHDLDQFWLVAIAEAGTSAINSKTAVFDVEREAREEAAKLFSANQGQKKVWLLEAVAVIDPVIPKVEWREDLKPLPAPTAS